MSEESPDARKDLSRPLTEELGNGDTTGTQAPLIALKNPSTTSPKAKARKAFSESQMNILVHKFSIQRYLPPAEMKSLAEMTGLTYKQVRRLIHFVGTGMYRAKLHTCNVDYIGSLQG